MIRLLLSLLALVSGLAVQVDPAQARLCEIEIGAPAPARLAAQGAVRAAAFAVVQGAPAGLAVGPPLRMLLSQITARPGVLVVIDRARE